MKRKLPELPKYNKIQMKRIEESKENKIEKKKSLIRDDFLETLDFQDMKAIEEIEENYFKKKKEKENLPHEYDKEKMKFFYYPKYTGIRKYQKEISEKILYNNTLVCLPTGLGKTVKK
jgi:superfamily II DNA or RNA helicase